MRSIGIGSAVVVSLILLIVLWVVSRALGFEVSLLGSLGLTVLLTLIVNLVLGAWAKRDRNW